MMIIRRSKKRRGQHQQGLCICVGILLDISDRKVGKVLRGLRLLYGLPYLVARPPNHITVMKLYRYRFASVERL